MTATATNKPPYIVPSMEEIRAKPWNGFNAISTFSGCGGSSTGYRMAGFKILWASEFIDAARESYAANKAPYTILDGRDIRQVKPEDILTAINLKPGELDLFDGSPPCASFSTAGKREAGWGKVKKYSDKLVSIGGYLGTVLSRLTLAGKKASGVPGDEIIEKELSLSGIQRPIQQTEIPENHRVFQFGEFFGAVIEC